MLKKVVVTLLCGASTLFPAVPLGCASGVPLGDVELRVQRDPKVPTLPLRGINRLEEGHTILYAPGKLRLNPKGGEVALVLAPAPAKPGMSMKDLPKLEVLDPKPANKPAQWSVPYRTGVVALVYGPQGLSAKKVKAFLSKDDDLIAQLADYAEKTAQTEALLAAISSWSTQGSSDVDAALNGFASQYGINNQIDPTLPRSQQTLLMMRTINPSLAGVDPVAADPSQRTAQSAVFATSVASIFFGTPVGLAASGGALALNLRGMMFPNTEIRSSFAMVPESGSDKSADDLALCGKRDPAKARMRVAYLWAARVPNVGPPAIKIGPADHLPLGVKAPLAVSMDDAAWKVVDRARDWKLVGEDGKTAFPAKVKSTADHKSLEIELAGAKVPAGRYHLQAGWDWDMLHATGDVYLNTVDDFKSARLVPESQDSLVEHRGRTVVQVESTDFEFVEKAALIEKGDKYNPPVSLPISLPKGKQLGPQDRLGIQMDTSGMAAGDYTLMLSQSDGKTYNVPIKVLPPAPRIANLPLVVNAGESHQSLELEGEHLDRLAKLEAPGAAFKLGPPEGNTGAGGARQLFVDLKPDARAGERLDLKEYAQNTSQPAIAPGGLKVVGPRPQILNATIALPDKNQISLFKDELPAGEFVNASLEVKHARAGTTVRLNCDAPAKEAVLHVGEQNAWGSVQAMGENTLFLTFNPGIWATGLTLSVVLENAAEGQSKPYVLGKVVRVPRVDSFELTDDKTDANYFGKLTGSGLEVIAKVGWSPDSGIAVIGLPVPLGGDSRKQSLQIALPWPPPSPRAPLWVWFRGDDQGRETKIRYGM